MTPPTPPPKKTNPKTHVKNPTGAALSRPAQKRKLSLLSLPSQREQTRSPPPFPEPPARPGPARCCASHGHRGRERCAQFMRSAASLYERKEGRSVPAARWDVEALEPYPCVPGSDSARNVERVCLPGGPAPAVDLRGFPAPQKSVCKFCQRWV